MTSSNKFDVVVLGSGVIGLSAALELHDAGFRVAVVAKDLPDDVTSTGWASPWAGCIWHSMETDPAARALHWDKQTFKRLEKLRYEHPDLCHRIEFCDVYNERVPKETIPWHDITGDFREVVRSSTEKIPGDHPHAHKYTSYALSAQNYTAYLGAQARSKGILFVRRRLSALNEAYDLPEVGHVDLVINATGLGAQTLIGVEDKAVYPVRGQTVLVKAPKVKMSIMKAGEFLANTKITDGDDAPPNASMAAYIIPRPGPEGHCILGGTYDRHVYTTLPDPDIARRILQECFKLEPALANGGTSWKDIEVVSINVGLRPSREGGARVELEKRPLSREWRIGKMYADPPKSDAEEVGVIHAYGFAGVGFIASLGAAEDVVELARQYKAGTREKRVQGQRTAKL